MTQPDYIFETSWEVCNRVGGIYAVLSTRAASMQAEHPDQVIFFGPDFGEHSNQFFREDHRLMRAWKAPIPVRVGRWLVPGNPIAILLRWEHLLDKKNEIYAWAWDKFQVKSHAAYGDYDESCLFGYAAGQVMESLYSYLRLDDLRLFNTPKVCMHANEWQTAFSLFYIKDHCPNIATLFTTHATGIGRSIAGNGKPLYDYFTGYNGDQMAEELNLVSKHSVEKMAAHHADCFTTVSDITARECAQLLDKPVDIVTPNGFESDFVPKTRMSIMSHRVKARAALTHAAETIMGGKVPENALYTCIAGRQEWKNKGIDVFLSSMECLADKIYQQHGTRQVIAFVMIPYLDKPYIRRGNVSVIFVPYYLNGNDPMMGMTYYDLLMGIDVTIFPSYYEPWGYTPLESISFYVPTITTSLAGFGAWAKKACKNGCSLQNSVAVIERTDSNYDDVVNQIADILLDRLSWDEQQEYEARRAAIKLSRKATWDVFFQYYRQAYNFAIKNAQKRVSAAKSTKNSTLKKR